MLCLFFLRPWASICTESWWFRKTLSSRPWLVAVSHWSKKKWTNQHAEWWRRWFCEGEVSLSQKVNNDIREACECDTGKCVSTWSSEELIGIIPSHFRCFWFGMEQLCGDGAEGVLVRGTVHAQTTVTCASHSCLSPLTVWACRPRKGPFKVPAGASSGCVCQRRNLGMCSLNKQGGERKRRGQRERFEGSGLLLLCLKCPEIPPVRAFLRGAFRQSREGFIGPTPDFFLSKDKLKV